MKPEIKNRLYFVATALLIIGVGVGGWFLFRDKPSGFGETGNFASNEALIAESDGQNPSGDEILGERVGFEVELLIDFGNGEEMVFAEFVGEGETAMNLLSKASQANGIEIEYQEYDFGRFVQSIGGKSGDSGRFWGFYINGEMADVGADSYVLLPGDVVEFRLTDM